MSVEFERAVVAGVLSVPDWIDALDPAPLPEHFQNGGMRQVWTEIQRRVSEAKAFDAVTLSDHFLRADRELGIQLQGVIAENAPANAAMLSRYAAAIVADWRRRSAMDVVQECQDALKRGDDSAIDRVVSALMDLDQHEANQFEWTQETAAAAAWAKLEHDAQSETIPGVPSGLEAMDRKIGGMGAGDLIVIGARPSMGKTALMLGMARTAAGAGIACGIISAEQPAEQLTQRQMSAVSGVPSYQMRTGNLAPSQWTQLLDARRSIGRWPILIYDRSQPSIGEIVRLARRWKRKRGIGVLFVDYIQRCKGDEGTKRNELVGSVCRGLKTLARDLEIPVVALSQVVRDVDRRDDKRPLIGDFADSSEIEKEADRMVTIYRDDVYFEDSDDAGLAELICVKHRHGPVGRVKVRFDGDTMRFHNIS